MTSDPRFPLLSAIDIPRDLRDLPESKLPQVAEELRGFLVESVGKTGGHLASSLGTVELTVALHYVYQTPEDRILWDVGHQAYGHKVLTGRRQRMDTLRMRDGLSGFLKRAESPYDAFGAGHSSTSIGAALGMAVAAQKQNSGRRVAAVIGDGALTAGMAFEALNHAGDLDVDLLVVLNDNDMSISPNVGGLSNYLARLLSGPVYSSMRESGKRMLSHTPFEELARRAEEHLKGMVMPGTLFEELGFNYIGPIDGHDLPTLVTALRNLRERSGPQFLHIVTQKGKGYAPAEAKPLTYHGVGRYDPSNGKLYAPAEAKPQTYHGVCRYDPSNGKLHKGKSSGPSYSQVFGDWLSATAERTPEMVAITPAMCTGSGMTAFADTYPDRFYDVGIAEQHALTLAAGMACEGLRPVVAIYSTFLQRAYDQLIHDIALQNLPVLFAIDRAGFVGNDGATHDGMFDLTYLRCVPNLVVMTPSDEEECRRMLSHTPFEELARRAEEHLKGMVMPGTLFEELGFNYIGPIDGHDLPTLVTALRNLRERSGPQFLHIVTQKGKGYAPAEAKPQTYHGVGRYDPSNGKLHKGKPSGPSYSQVFGDWLPAMCTGSGMTAFADAYPDRFYDVGIAEQHALTLAAGMACEGLRPVVAIYSTFLQRAYDQLIHDIALQNLPVLLAIDRAGFVGNDGATHDGIFDLSYLRCIPNLVVMTPSDEEECRRMLSTGLAHDGPSAVRYPRGTGRGVQPSGDDLPLEIGRGVVRREGRGVALLAFGSLLGNALEVGDGLDATVADMRFVKPLDNDLVDRLAASHDLLVTLEENVVAGGAGSAVAEHLHRNGATSRLLQIGIPDRFFAHGSPADVVADAGLDAASIRAAIDSALAGEASNSD